MEFLGHHVSAAGAKPLTSYVEKIEAPITVNELQILLGLVNFCRRFLAAIATPFCPSQSAEGQQASV